MYKEDWKNKVVDACSNHGASLRHIAKKLGIPKSTVSDFYRNHKKDEHIEKEKRFNDFIESLKTDNENTPDYSRILVISDMHIPFHHPSTFMFLEEMKKKYMPTFVVCIGDEADKSALSYHESSTTLPSAADELILTQHYMRRLEKIFPEMVLLNSNHGSLAFRRATTARIPKEYLKDYNELYGVGGGWKWVDRLVVDSDNTSIMFTHGISNDATKLAKSAGMCVVQGHYHTLSKVEYFQNMTVLGKEKKPVWAMQLGCLINDKSEAFLYNKSNLTSPLINCGMIINGKPEIVFMNELVKESVVT